MKLSEKSDHMREDCTDGLDRNGMLFDCTA